MSSSREGAGQQLKPVASLSSKWPELISNVLK